jgi:hypothetical protein
MCAGRPVMILSRLFAILPQGVVVSNLVSKITYKSRMPCNSYRLLEDSLQEICENLVVEGESPLDNEAFFLDDNLDFVY